MKTKAEEFAILIQNYVPEWNAAMSIDGRKFKRQVANFGNLYVFSDESAYFLMKEDGMELLKPRGAIIP